MKLRSRFLWLFWAVLLITPLFILPAQATTIASGEFSGSLHWELTSEGVLTVSGNGKMGDYEEWGEVPWFPYREEIIEVVIANGVTNIGENAFFGERNLMHVTIPESVTSIGEGAFQYCESLPDLLIPNSVIEIGSNAFWGCNSFTEVALPDSLIVLGDSAFCFCENLTAATIPQNVSSISYSPFLCCPKLEGIEVSANNPYYESIDGVLFSENLEQLIQYPCAKEGSYTIPEGVRSILHYAFRNCDGLTGVVFPQSLLSIDSCSFESCDGLTIVTIPGNVKEIGPSAFEDCNNLISVFVPSSIVTIGNSAFSCCDSLTTIDVDENNESYTSIDGVLFSKDHASLVQHPNGKESTYVIPNGVSTINCFAFQDNRKLVSVTIPFSVTYIDSFAFDHCFNLTDVHYIGSQERWNGLTIDSYNQSLLEATLHFEEFTPVVCAYASNPDLALSIGDEMSISYALFVNGEHSALWDKPAFAISDENIAEIKECKKSNIGYKITLCGKKAGSTQLTVTDTDSGAYVTVKITVRDTYTVPLGYVIDDVPSFYPEIPLSPNLQTNVYDCYGLYINDFPEASEIQKENGEYYLEFNIYNEKSMYGAIDVYDAYGVWIRSYPIDKYTGVQGMYDAVEGAVYLVRDLVTGNILNYSSDSISAHTRAKIVVPEGGFFTISNNYLQSPGVFVYNSIDLSVSAVNSAFDLSLESLDSVFEETMDTILADEQFYGIFIKEFSNVAQTISAELALGNYGAAAELCSNNFIGFLKRLNIDFWSILKIQADISEEVFKKLTPEFIEKGFDTVFGIQKATDYVCQIIQIGDSVQQPYVNMYTPEGTGGATVNGVTVIPGEGALQENAVLQVFRIANSDQIIVSETGFVVDQYELYNICYTVNNTEVQPNGKVTIKIPIPESFDEKQCTVYHQQEDGSWRIVNGKLENGFIVFEVNHFSLFAIGHKPSDTNVGMTGIELFSPPVGGVVAIVVLLAIILIALSIKRRRSV